MAGKKLARVSSFMETLLVIRGGCLLGTAELIMTHTQSAVVFYDLIITPIETQVGVEQVTL